ncbi:hypothetical protein [Pelagibacterium lentulum]|uniref:hypothetical protein n=1 Tax=Pelagibacterium lentulum TaxID=2029865 RepID=UPI001FCF0511
MEKAVKSAYPAATVDVNLHTNSVRIKSAQPGDALNASPRKRDILSNLCEI